MRVAPTALAVAALTCGFAAIAQQNSDALMPAAPSAATPAPAAGSAPRSKVDDSALRYFAAQGDTRRANAEIARLRALYPDWTPPSDLTQLSAAGDDTITKLWDLFNEDKIAEVRAAIAERQATEPSWKPPEDLVKALAIYEARRRLVNASDSGQWRTVLAVATETPSLLTCENVDMLWRVAEAFAKTDEQGRTRDAYTYILTNCSNPTERVATLQKALDLLPEQQITELLQFERKGGATPDDFTPIRDELARRRVGRAALDSTIIASAEDLAVVERMAQSSNEPDNMILLGWYHHHHNGLVKALDLFKIALDRKGGPKAAAGYAMSLRELNRLVEAEAIAYEWRDKSPENMKIYLDVTTALLSQDPPIRLEPQVVTRVVAPILEQRAVDAAQALGWYSYNTGQPRTAREWFRKALSWKPDDEPSAYGVALSSKMLNDTAAFNAIIAQWKGRSQRIADLAAGIFPSRKPPVSGQPVAGQPLAALPPSASAIPANALPVAYASAEPVTQRRVATVPAEERYAERYVEQDPYVGSAMTGTRSRVRRNCSIIRDPNAVAPAAALSMGWCLMEMNRPLEAVVAFDQVIKRGAGRMREEAAYGKSLAYLRKSMTAEAAVAAAEAPLARSRSVELSAAILAQRAEAAFKEGRYVETLMALSERARIVPEQNDLMIIRGWSYLKLRRFDDAARVFRAVQRTGYSEAASAGLNAVYEATNSVRF